MIRVERRGAVAVITLDRQERRNAIDQGACRALVDAVDETEDARVLVLTGAGGHFCAGADLTNVEDTAFVEALRAALTALRDVPKPVIAAVADALKWADEIAVLAPLTIAGHKLMLNRCERDVHNDPEVADAFARAWRSADLAEGMAAFRERRAPRFSGD